MSLSHVLYVLTDIHGNILRKEIPEAIYNMNKQQKRKIETRLGGLLAKIRNKNEQTKNELKSMLHINFGNVGPVSTSCEEFAL